MDCQRGPDGNIRKVWEFKRLESQPPPLRVSSAADGSMWFIVGTDQLYFGALELYYTRFTATLIPE